MLKYFASTHRTQGERDNDTNTVPGTELVDIAGTSHDAPDDAYCACARSFVGFGSGQATTTAEVVEDDITPVEYIRRYHAKQIAQGFQNTPALRTDATNDAVYLLLLAACWPVGTVVERRGDEICTRSIPDNA